MKNKNDIKVYGYVGITVVCVGQLAQAWALAGVYTPSDIYWLGFYLFICGLLPLVYAVSVAVEREQKAKQFKTSVYPDIGGLVE